MKIKSGLFFVSLFAVGMMPLYDAWAGDKGVSCVDSGTGYYLLTSHCRKCPAGCYCPTVNEQRYKLDPKNYRGGIKKGDVEDWCGRKIDVCQKLDKETSPSYYQEYNAGCGRNEAAKVFRCPDDFPFSAEQSVSDYACYKMVGNKKLYHRVRSCDPGFYLPVNSDLCTACPTGEKDYCPGFTAQYPSVSGTVGLEMCGVGQKASSDHTRCESTSSGGTVSLEKLKVNSFGTLKKATDSKNDDVSGGTDNPDTPDTPSGKDTTVEVGAGYYLPANSTGIADIKSCGNLGRDEYCPGGTFELNYSKRQGVEICSYSVNSMHSACELKLTAEQMKYGIMGGKSGNHNNACWALTDPDEFKECVGVRQDFLDLIRGNSADK